MHNIIKKQTAMILQHSIAPSIVLTNSYPATEVSLGIAGVYHAHCSSNYGSLFLVVSTGVAYHLECCTRTMHLTAYSSTTVPTKQKLPTITFTGGSMDVDDLLRSSRTSAASTCCKPTMRSQESLALTAKNIALKSTYGSLRDTMPHELCQYFVLTSLIINWLYPDVFDKDTWSMCPRDSEGMVDEEVAAFDTLRSFQMPVFTRNRFIGYVNPEVFSEHPPASGQPCGGATRGQQDFWPQLGVQCDENPVGVCVDVRYSPH